MATQEIFIWLNPYTENFLIQSWTLAFDLSYFYPCGSVFGTRIRIHKVAECTDPIRIRIPKAAEYGSNFDPDPKSC